MTDKPIQKTNEPDPSEMDEEALDLAWAELDKDGDAPDVPVPPNKNETKPPQLPPTRLKRLQ